jgi:hypothetical protein
VVFSVGPCRPLGANWAPRAGPDRFHAIRTDMKNVRSAEGLTAGAPSAQRGAMARLSRRQPYTLVVGLVVILGFVLGAGWFGVRRMDQKQYVSQQQLQVALLTFYHSPATGQTDPLSIDDLSQRTIIVQPAPCVPLAAASSTVTRVVGAMGWSGTVGDPPQWVNFVTVRFGSAADARRTLLSKRAAIVRCHQIRATFPPFDHLSQLYDVADHSSISPLRLNQARYTLSGEDSHEFYMRQFANTLTWAYGSADNSSTARTQAVDSLVARLQELEQEL